LLLDHILFISLLLLSVTEDAPAETICMIE